MNNNLQDMKASGSVKLSGGHYREVGISGSAHISGDIVCESFRASGSAHVNGGVECGDFRISGSGRIEGDVKAGDCVISGSGAVTGALSAQSLQVSGSVRVDGGITTKEQAHISGSANVNGALRARTLKTSGSLRVGNGIECETLTSSGVLNVDGLINAGTADISLAGQSRLDEIGGEHITVRRRPGLNLNVLGFSLSLGLMLGQLTATTIEANVIELEATRANVVRGTDVTIGAGCEIDRVEYSGTLSINDNAMVREQVKVD